MKGLTVVDGRIWYNVLVVWDDVEYAGYIERSYLAINDSVVLDIEKELAIPRFDTYASDGRALPADVE